MSDAAEMLRELSYPWSPGERVKSIIDRTSRMCRLTYWRTFDIWYRKARKIEPYEIAQIAEALRIKNERAARNELHDLKFRIAKLEATLSGSRDPDFHCHDIDYARELMRGSGRVGSTMADKGRGVK